MKSQSGLTLAEVLVVVAIMGIGLGISAIYVKPMASPLASGAALLEGFLREARMSAIATTSARRVSDSGSGRLIGESAASCSATTWSADTDLTLNLPESVTSGPSGWNVCFSSRGISSDNVQIVLSHPQAGTTTVEVLLGGTTQVLP